MEQPTVSVIIPVYNSAAYLGDCLNSVLAQTYSNLEVICINDGSSDESGHILKKYATQDNRLTIITQENHGPGAARNRGLDIARGRYVFFVDSDDILHREALGRFVTIGEQTGTDVVCGRFMPLKYPSSNDETRLEGTFVHEGRPLTCFTAPHTRTPITVWNKLFRRDIFKKRRFIPDVYYEDVALTLSVFSDAKSCALTPDKTYLYRNGNISIMRSRITQKKIDNYASVLLFVYQEFCKKKKTKELDLLFKNYFTRMNTFVLKMLRGEESLENHFWQRMSFLTKAGLVPYREDNTLQIARHWVAQPTPTGHTRE